MYIMHRRVLALRVARGTHSSWLSKCSGDAAGIVAAVADIPGRATLHHLKFLRVHRVVLSTCNVCGGPSSVST